MRTKVVRAFHRQQVRVSPHAARTVLDLLPRDDLLHLGIVVFDFKRAEAHLTDVNGLRGIFFPAFPTYERFHFGHCHTTFINYGLTSQPAYGSPSSNNSVIVGCSPQRAHCGFRFTLISLNWVLRASKSRRRSVNGRPIPRTSLSASVAWIVPMIPASTPITPASWQEATSPGGGGVLNTHR